ncbi:MAG: CxxC-x17-CxxC domain-containing protein [Patescibacteria group bacterium]
MERFNQGGGRGFGGNRGGGSRFGGRDRETSMHEAVCAECHKDCQVPFKPSGDRPVYCKDCFAKMGGSPRSSFDNSPKKDFGHRPQTDSSFGVNRNNDEVKRQLEAINIKLDNLIKAVGAMPKPANTPEPKAKKTTKKKVIKK